MCDQSSLQTKGNSVWLPQVVMIESIRPEVQDVATYCVRHRDESQGPFAFAPGQFNMLYVPGCGEVAISISGASEDGKVLEHTIRHTGRVTNVIASLQPGAEIGIRGPFGRAWPLGECQAKNIVLLAGGLGFAPLKPVIESIIRERQKYGAVTLFIGTRSPELLLFNVDYERWRAFDIEIQVTVDRDPQNLGYVTGVVPLLIDRWQPLNSAETVAMVCGPEIMMEYSARSLLKKGLEASSIYVSLERNMQCAVGFCGHCQLGPTFVCKDGPVLSYDRVQDAFAVRDL